MAEAQTLLSQVMQGDVDVLMPIRSPAPWLSEALESLRDQTFHNWRLVAVIHGDDSELLRPLRDSGLNMKIIWAESYLNLAQVLNLGLENCSAEFIARLDSDDIALPKRFEEQFQSLHMRLDSVMSYSPAVIINEFGRNLGYRDVPGTSTELIDSMLWKNSIIHSSVMFRRDLVNLLGGYSTKASHVEDYQLWLRLLALGEGRACANPGIKYRVHSQQVTRNTTISHASRKAIGAARSSFARSTGRSVTYSRLQQLIWSFRQIVRQVYSLALPKRPSQ